MEERFSPPRRAVVEVVLVLTGKGIRPQGEGVEVAVEVGGGHIRPLSYIYFLCVIKYTQILVH